MVNDFGVQAPLKYLESYTQSHSKLHVNNLNKSFNSINDAPKSANKIIEAGLVGDPSWITWASSSTTSKGAISGLNNPSFSTTWTVPSLPTNLYDGQNFFIFDAVCDATGSNIVQPVLQFGNDGRGGSATSWSIFNAYMACDSCTFFTGAYVPVSTGETLTGRIQLTGLSSTLQFLVNGNSQSNNFTVPPMTDPFAQFYVTLEGYNIKSGADYPPDPDDYVQMSNSFITNLTGGSNPDNMYGEHTVIPPNTVGVADLYFRNPPPPPNISYTQPFVYKIGTQVTLSPTNTGGPVTGGYSISPTTLPPGLTFPSATGIISGNPTGYIQSAPYTVTATNGGGSGSYTITLTPAGNSVTYTVSSSQVASTSFNLTVNNSGGGTDFKTSSTVTNGGPDKIPGVGTSSGSKVILQVTGGYMPPNALLNNYPYPAITGTISGNTITFNNVNLSAPTTVTIFLDANIK